MKFGLRYASLGRYANGPAAVELARVPTMSCCSLSKSDFVAKKQPPHKSGIQSPSNARFTPVLPVKGLLIDLVIANMSLLPDLPVLATTLRVAHPWYG